MTPASAAQIDDRRAHVIAAAMELFWRHGYDGVSVGDLVDATGMNRYTLYQAFGGKKEIFMAVLKSYVDEAHSRIKEILEQPNVDPFDAARDAIVMKMLDPEIFPAGCLICTTAVDVAAHDQDVADMMAVASKVIGQTFAEAYARAHAAGLASRRMTPEAFAELINAVYFSTGVQARMGRSREELLNAVNLMVESLRYRPSA